MVNDNSFPLSYITCFQWINKSPLCSGLHFSMFVGWQHKRYAYEYEYDSQMASFPLISE